MEWYQGYVSKKRKRPEIIKRQIYGDIIPLLGNIELDKLKTIDITMALDSIVARDAPIQANRVLSSIKQSLTQLLVVAVYNKILLLVLNLEILVVWKNHANGSFL